MQLNSHFHELKSPTTKGAQRHALGWLGIIACVVCWTVMGLLLTPHAAQAQRATPEAHVALPTEVIRIPLAAFLEDFLLDTTNNRLYVTDQSGTLSVLDATDYTLLATIPTVAQAHLTLDPDHTRLYVTPAYRRFGEIASIQVVDTATLTVTATITNATDITFDPARNRIFVGNRLLRPTPPNSPVAGLRVLDATTLATVTEAALDGVPLYNPSRDELLLVARSLYRVDPESLTVLEDLFPEITAQECLDCIGTHEIANVQLLTEERLLAVDPNVHSTPTGGRVLPTMRFLDASTLAEVQPQPVAQPTCNRRARLQPQLDNRIYRHHAYASTYVFHNWQIESTTGTHLRTLDGLDAPFLNPNTNQAYAGGWVLALPAVEPVGRMPALTCILDYDQTTGLIYGQFQNQLVALAETGGALTAAATGELLEQLPEQTVTAITPAPNFTETQTLFVTQYDRLYRSTDGGDQWQLLDNLPLNGETALHVALSPKFREDQTLFVGGGMNVGQPDQLAGGVFRSTDGGDSWQPLWHGLDYLRINRVAVAPNYPDDPTVLAYGEALSVSTGFHGEAIQRSTDGGLAWSTWLTMTKGALPVPSALLPAATPPPPLPVKLDRYNYQLLRPAAPQAVGQLTHQWEGIDLPGPLGSAARALVTAPDVATSGVVYLMGDSALWRIWDVGATIEAWTDERLTGRTTYTEVLTSLAVTPLESDGTYRLMVGTGGGEVWVLDPAAMAWSAPLTLTATPATPQDAGIVTQPLLSYRHALTTTGPVTTDTVTTDTVTGELVLRNTDGTGRRAVALPPAIKSVSSRSIAPDGRWLAYYTGNVSRPTAPGSDDLTLHLLDVATGTSITVTRLLPPDFPVNLQTNAQRIAARLPDVADDPQLVEGIWWAFADALTLHAWSPDGGTLAFAGATDGPSSDLYLYDVDTGKLTRLTDGPEQIAAMRWSPDGRWIWHSSVAIGLCQGCYGHKYAAARDGSEIISIPGDEGDRFLGWLGPATYLESKGANGIGYFDLHTVNLTGEPGQTLWPGVWNGFVLDWSAQQLVVDGAPEVLVGVLSEGQTLYDIDLQSGSYQTTTITNTVAARWRGALQLGSNQPLPRCPTLDTNTAHTMLVYPCNDGAVSPHSPDGRWQVTQDLTLQTVNGRTVLPSAVEQTSQTIFWRPDSAGFYYLVEETLYYRPLLDSWPMLIERGVSGVAWVEGS